MIAIGDTEIQEIRVGDDYIEKVALGNNELWPQGSEEVHKLAIGGLDLINGESCTFSAIYDDICNVTNSALWSVVSGNQYATIDNTGELIIDQSANDAEVIIQASYQGLIAQRTLRVTYVSGSSIETETTTEIDTEGNTTTTTTVVINNSDGSSESTSESTTYDLEGNVTGSSENTTVNNVDGSSTSNTINYNAEGNPTDAVNQSTDTSGNINTQDIEYNEDGDPIVTGYTIDTSNNPEGEKELNADGINTNFYAFDMTDGFILNLHFTIDFSNQPPGQNQNHHQILSMKRSTPEPWYGIQIRQSGSNKYIQLGTQFATGSNTNTQITPGRTISTNVREYDIRIIYDPLAINDNFVCKELISNTIVKQESNTFPDLPELEYLTVCLGYGLDENGDPYRYSNIDVLNFSITKLSIALKEPNISCDGQRITLTCETPESSIYYRLQQTGSFVLYTSPIPISSDTYVEAYSMLGNRESQVVTELCEFDGSIEDPIINCDGRAIVLTCETPSVDIYYRLNQLGEFILYENPIQINADTIIEAYSELDGVASSTVSETCIYIPQVLSNPVITCDGLEVTITCDTVGAEIYYRLNQSGNYSQYTSPITINADTVVEAYSTFDGDTSSIVSETCIYNPTHHYETDYLTLRILTNGTIAWRAFGSGYTKTIQYSKNGGEWTSLTAASTSPTIPVVADDVIRLKGTNSAYAGSKSNYDGFEGGTALFDVEGNIMSLIYGDNFIGNNTLTSTYAFCSLFKNSNVISAENLVLPATTLTGHCYRAMFSGSTLTMAPKLPATTLADSCYWYMFEACSIETAPDLLATTLVTGCYGHMFVGCSNLNFIKCLATSGFNTTNCLASWVGKKNAESTIGVADTGIFVKDSNMSWSTGVNGIPTNWTVCNDEPLYAPTISYDGDYATLSCQTPGADIYYKLNQVRSYTLYTTPILISQDTVVEAYSEYGGQSSSVVSETCEYISNVPIEYANRDINNWKYNNQNIQLPYSVNAIDGHSSSYAKGTFNFEASFILRTLYPTYLWFQHADQSATVYIDNVLVEKHWGGYNAFFVDVSNFVHVGSNNLKVALKNNEGNNLAPAAGDFNFNATLGNVKLLTSPALPDKKYGYDGFHITSEVTPFSAIVNIKTTVPNGASVKCIIDDGNYYHEETKNSIGEELTFTDTITGNDLHFWHGTVDPHLYTVTLEISYNGDLYHRFQRPYGLRFYDYVYGDNPNITYNGQPYTGFLLNGSPYFLRGVCMHDDLEGKANALNSADYTQEFSIIRELGCNFIRLAHYPHPKEVYDLCDQYGIVVQTEVPCVNKLQSTMPSDYYTHLTDQYKDMVNQHYNHPCILFWGLFNETTTDDKTFAKSKIEEYAALIKGLDSERWVGYVMSHSYNNPSGYYNNPEGVDWFGGNIYVGWYIDKASNNPTSQINTRITNTTINLRKPYAFSEYGCGGTQHCHSEDPQTTTTKGNYERHDIEYQMWLHEGHISAIRNIPEMLFSAEWQLFDIAVANRNEGYTICLDGETTSIDDNLRRLNNKGLVERDHITKKDTFYLYKAEWNPTKFVHICGKDYTKRLDRVIKCYTNNDILSLYVNNNLIETVNVVDHIAYFTAMDFNLGDVIRVGDNTIEDTFTI